MGRPRIELQQLFETFGAAEVYFQPPSNKAMVYPCIRYQPAAPSIQYADNKPHRNDPQYMVMIIDPDPDSAIAKLVASLPLCSFSRFYTADNLNHFVYNLYF